MNLVTGDAIWTRINKIPTQYPYLTEDLDCDVVIIGGGITGALCSYYFTEAGIRTVLVERDVLGYQSTSASTSLLQYEIDYLLKDLKEMIGFENALTSYRLCEKAIYDIKNMLGNFQDDCGFELRESLLYPSSPSELEGLHKEYLLRKENGFDVEFLDRQNSTDRFSFKIAAGILSRSGAAEIDPYRFEHALISHAVTKGLRVFENTEITDIQSSKEDVVLKTKLNFKLKAKKAVVCTGFEAVGMIKEEIVNFTRTFTLATKPVENFDGWNNRCLIRDTSSTYTYYRTTQDGRILIGGEDNKIGGTYSKMSNLTEDDQAGGLKYEILIHKLKTMFPEIRGIEAELKFSGIFAETKDSLPYLGEYTEMPNCYFCLGYGSNGILYDVFGAQMLRDLYLGNHRPELEIFKFGR